MTITSRNVPVQLAKGWGGVSAMGLTSTMRPQPSSRAVQHELLLKDSTDFDQVAPLIAHDAFHTRPTFPSAQPSGFGRLHEIGGAHVSPEFPRDQQPYIFGSIYDSKTASSSIFLMYTLYQVGVSLEDTSADVSLGQPHSMFSTTLPVGHAIDSPSSFRKDWHHFGEGTYRPKVLKDDDKLLMLVSTQNYDGSFGIGNVIAQLLNTEAEKIKQGDKTVVIIQWRL